MQLVQQYFYQNDIPIDAIYSAQDTAVAQSMAGADTTASENNATVIKDLKNNHYDIWEDYKQIYLDFSLNSD